MGGGGTFFSLSQKFFFSHETNIRLIAFFGHEISVIFLPNVLQTFLLKSAMSDYNILCAYFKFKYIFI